MGCDIHIWAERNTGKPHKDDDKSFVWEHVPSCRWWESRAEMESRRASCAARGKTYKPDEEPSDLPCFDPSRNYTLFAVLANVRNKGQHMPILIEKMHREGKEPELKTDRYGYTSFDHVSVRGIPADASDFVKARTWEYGADGHSHSWLTLRELQEHNWDAPAEYKGVVDVVEYIRFKEHARPNEWSEYVGGRTVKQVSNAEMDAYIAAGQPNDGFARVTEIAWQVPVGEYCKNFTGPIMAELAKLDPNPDNVRIVFFFDN